MSIFVRESPLKRLERQMAFEGVESFVVTCCMDTDNKIHIPSETTEYSKDKGNLDKIPVWLVEEIYEAMMFRKSHVVLDRHVGRTMYVNVGQPR